MGSAGLIELIPKLEVANTPGKIQELVRKEARALGMKMEKLVPRPPTSFGPNGKARDVHMQICAYIFLLFLLHVALTNEVHVEYVVPEVTSSSDTATGEAPGDIAPPAKRARRRRGSGDNGQSTLRARAKETPSREPSGSSKILA